MTPIAFAATESLERTFEEDVQAADDCSIEVLIERYRQLIYGIALSGTGNAHDAEDVFQETFLAYYRAKKSFRSEEHRRAWLIRTACNHCKKITGSTWRKRTVSLEEVPEQSFTFSLPEENELFAAFHTLSLQNRTVLYLHDFAGYTSEEIGKMLKMRPGTIRMQLTRGRAILRKQLKGDEPDAFG